MTTVREALATAINRLQAADINSARLDSELLLAHVLGYDRAWLLAHDDHQLHHDEVQQFNKLIDERVARKPLVHLTGQREFYGLELAITPDVLTPRVETEKMVEWAIELTPKGSRLIDVGTGSGALAIAIAKHRPDLEVWASEISPEALEVARTNAQTHGVSIRFIEADLLGGIDVQFATIVTNLPYLISDADLMPEVRHEPGVALFGGSGDGLDLYRRFLTQVPTHLEATGYVFTECDPWQQDALKQAASAHGLECSRQDYFVLGFRNAAN